MTAVDFSPVRFAVLEAGLLYCKLSQTTRSQRDLTATRSAWSDKGSLPATLKLLERAQLDHR